MKNFKLAHSKSGLPCLWETGGAYTSRGSATIIAGADGERLKPLYIRRRGELACGEHALIVITAGMVVVTAGQWHGDYDISVYTITDIGQELASARCEYHFSEGEWDRLPSDKFVAAIEAAKRKAASYHCRQPYYILPDNPAEGI